MADNYEVSQTASREVASVEMKTIADMSTDMSILSADMKEITLSADIFEFNVGRQFDYEKRYDEDGNLIAEKWSMTESAKGSKEK